MQSEQAVLKREDTLDKASSALNDARISVKEARSAVDRADDAVYAAAEDIRNAKTDEERAEARQRELNAMQQQDKANQRYEEAKLEYEQAKLQYEQAKLQYEKAEQRYEQAKLQYEEAKKDAQNLFAEQREQAIAFRDCIPSERTSQHARALASMIKKGEDDFQSLEYQRKALKLPELAKPLPYRCLDDMKMHTALWFVQRVGSGLDKFSRVVRGLAEPSNTQDRKVLVVAQSSGSGKTKLAHDVALEKGVASVIATVIDTNNDGLTMPFVDLAKKWPALFDAEYPHGVESETERIGDFNGDLFVVVLAAHVEWAAHVAEELHKLGPRQRSESDANRAIVMSTSNGAGQFGISSLVQNRLDGIPHIRKVDSSAQLANWAKEYVLSAASKLQDAQVALRGEPAGTPVPQVLVTIDEAPRLIVQRFGTKNDHSSSWLRAAAHALAVMTNMGVASCMTGTFFDVAKLLDDTYSPLRGRTCGFYHAENITSALLWHDLLRRHVPTLPEVIPPSIQADLERLEGRPIFLFDILLTEVFAELAYETFSWDESGWPEDIRAIVDPSARRFAGFLYLCLRGAWHSSVNTMVERIEKFTMRRWKKGKPPVMSESDGSQLLLQMLDSVFLEGGQLPLLKADYGTRSKNKDKNEEIMKDAVRQGVLVYDPTEKGSVLQEHVTVEAVRKVGRNIALSREPMEDEWLRDTSRMLRMRKWRDSKGLQLESAFAWMLIRACDDKDDGVKLQDALAGVVPDGFVFPKSVRDKIVKITGASHVPVVGDGKMDDWRAMSGTSTIWYDFHQNAGMDLMMRTTDGTVIGVQAKSGKVDLADAVASCSLGWQYFSRKPIASKSNTFLRKPGNLRRWFLDHAPFAAGEEHPRLVFSVKDFSPRAVGAVNAYNELRPQSAILLCQSSDAVLGPLHGALKDLTNDNAIDLNPSSTAAALMVHQDVGGKNGLQGAGQSFSEWLAEEKKGRR